MSTNLSEADVAAIKKALDMGLKALEDSDETTWLSYWTKDAVSMLPGSPRRTGTAELKELYPLIGGKKYILSDIRIEGRDDLAVVTTALAVPRDTGAPDPAKQILVLRKQPDGKWLIAANCVNLDVPGEL